MSAADEPELLAPLRSEIDHIRKRLRGMAMISRGIVPNLALSRRVVARMLTAASQYVADETGEAMVGFVVHDDTPEGRPTIYALDTISPDETAVRRSHTFQQGDALQDEVIWWLQENWHYHREKQRGAGMLDERFDVPLRYLGDWHKQPGSMIEPSHGDLMTALAWLDDDESGMDFLLVPIVTTGYEPVVRAADNDVNFIHEPMADGTHMRVDWWYIHRDVRVFQPLRPQIVAPDTLPQMMKYGWHVVRADRLTREHHALEEDGLLLRTLFYECDGEVPLEFCFIAIRQGAASFLLLVTRHDYPRSAPKAYRAPFVAGVDLSDPVSAFGLLWQEAEAIADPPGFAWNESKFLLDFVEAIEVDMGIREPRRVTIPVDDDSGAGDISAVIDPVSAVQPERGELT